MQLNSDNLGLELPDLFIELPARKPWNPSRLMSISFIGTYFLAILALSINWKRLGKSEWVSTSIFFLLLLVAANIATFALLIRFNLFEESPYIGSILSSVFGLNIGYMFALWQLQNPAFKKWRNHNDILGMLNHKYNFVLAGGWIAAFTLGTMLIFLLVVFAALRPETFEGQSFSLTYSRWQRVDPTIQRFCNQRWTGCSLYLSRSSVGAFFVEIPMNRAQSLDVVLADWEQDKLSGSTVTNLVQSQITIDGYNATVYEYSHSSKARPNQYIMDIFVPTKFFVLHIEFFSGSKDSFVDNKKRIDQLLNKIKLKDPL